MFPVPTRDLPSLDHGGKAYLMSTPLIQRVPLETFLRIRNLILYKVGGLSRIVENSEGVQSQQALVDLGGVLEGQHRTWRPSPPHCNRLHCNKNPARLSVCRRCTQSLVSGKGIVPETPVSDTMVRESRHLRTNLHRRRSAGTNQPNQRTAPVRWTHGLESGW